MRFSRDNIIISNRCGEYINAHKYFNLLNLKDDSEVSLWFINSLDKNRFGAPCGFTSGKYAKLYLLKAIEASKKNWILIWQMKMEVVLKKEESMYVAPNMKNLRT